MADQTVSVPVSVLIVELMTEGRWPLGFWSEANTAVNARFIPLLVDAFEPDIYPDFSVALVRVMHRQGLATPDRMRFLSDPSALLVTAIGGKETIFTDDDIALFLDEEHQPKFAGETLKNIRKKFRANPTKKAKARNLRFAPTTGHFFGKVMSLADNKTYQYMMDPKLRPVGRTLLRPGHAHFVTDTLHKLLHFEQLNARVETLLSTKLEAPLDELIKQLRGYRTEALPDYPSEAQLRRLLDELERAKDRVRQLWDAVPDAMRRRLPQPARVGRPKTEVSIAEA